MIRRTITLMTLLGLAAMPAVAADYSHQEYFEHYEGTQTCLTCHQDEAESFFHSQHYQWLGDAPDITLKGPGGFIRIDGSVKERTAETVNKDLPTGEIEVFPAGYDGRRDALRCAIHFSHPRLYRIVVNMVQRWPDRYCSRRVTQRGSGGGGAAGDGV